MTEAPDPSSAIVRILKKGGGTAAGADTAGTGFVVSADGLVATCAHVVELAGSGPGGEVRLLFHARGAVGDAEASARVVPETWRPPTAEDVAFLRLAEPLPEPVTPLALGSSGDAVGRAYRTFGFPAAKPVEGMPGVVEVTGRTTEAGFPVLQVRSNEVSLGFSGAPAWDERLNTVTGMVISVVPAQFDPAGKQTEVSYLTPVETLRAICPSLGLGARCPYRGLEVFDEEHADLYFGREAATEALLRRLTACDFVAVVGVSGSGKSSLVRAGLKKGLATTPIPGLADRPRCTFKPGRAPFLDLAVALATAPDATAARVEDQLGLGAGTLSGPEDALREANERLERREPGDVAAALQRYSHAEGLLLVVDQFERLFTDLHDDDARRRFIETLVAVAGEDVKVLVTLRADFYGTALENPGVARALDRGQLTLLRMSDTELLRAITAPAHNENRSFEPGLPERLAADVTGHPGDLPLVEFTLTELWQRDGDTGVLTAATYDELGSVGLSGERFPGVQGAIARRADEVWRELDPDERAAARRVFLSLVAAGPVDERGQQIASDASRRAWQQVEWDDATRAVAAKLVDARLLTTGQDPFSKEPTVEVAHEALIRAWPQLQQWVATQPEFVRWYDHDLAPSLRRWWEHEKHPEFLLPGVMLPPAEHWLGENPEGLSGRPAEYIRASVEAWRQEQQRLEHERRRLERALAEAERQHAIVQARELAARAELTRTAGLRLLERSVLLTVESLRRVPTFEGDQALRGGLALLRRRSALVPADGDVTGYTFRAFSRDGRRLVISRGDGSVLVSEAASGSEIRRLGPEHQLSGVALSADGRRLAANGPGGAIHVIDVASGAEVNRISGKDARGAAGALALDADGRRVARAWADGSADVWEVASRARLASVRGEHEAVLRGVAFGPREGLLLTRGDNEPARVWDLSTERELAALAHERGSTTAVACSPTGAFVATGGTDWAVRVWETDAWSQVVRFAHELELRDLAFSGDGRLLASASADGMTLVWRVDGWREEARLRHLDVGNVAFASGTMLVTVGLDGGRAVWELGTGRSPAVFVHEGPVHGVAFSADGSLLASAGGDNMARIWELESGRELPCLGHDEAVVAVAFSHDAARVATVSWDQTARVWDLVTARELTRASHGGWPSSTVAFSPDGGRIAGASLRAALVWDAWSGTELARLDHERGTVFGVDFSPDGALLAAADSNEGVLIWRLRTQAPPARLGHPWGLTDVAFSRDGSLLATASGSTGDARVWEVASGKERLRVAHERPWATAVSFSADGERLATGGRDGTARVWDVATSDELVRIGHAGAVNDVALSPDGAWLATACEDGAARVFPLRPEDLIGEACRRLSRNLTEEEWRQYLGGEPYRKTCPELP